MLLKTLGIAVLSLALLAPLSIFGAGPGVLVSEEAADSGNPSAEAAAPGAQAVERGRALMLQGRLDEARDILEAVIAADPGDAQAHRWLGNIALREQRPEDGIALLQRAVELAPDDPAPRLDLGEAYEGLGRFTEAERTYRELLARDEQQPENWFRLGEILERSGGIDQAIEAYQRVVADPQAPPPRARASAAALDRLYAQRVEAWLEDIGQDEVGVADSIAFGRTLVDRRRFDDAQRIFEALVEREPNDAQIRYWYGRLLFTRRQIDEGIEQLERSVELAPDNLRLKMELARTYEAAGRIGPARAAFVEVLAGTGDEALAREARQRVSLIDARRAVEAGELEDALAIYQRLIDDQPGDPRLLELIAPVLEELGRHEESDRIFAQMLERRPDDANLRMRVAATWERRGEVERAQPMYAEVLAMQPSGDLAALALERLGLNRAADLLHQGEAEQALALFDRVNALVPDSPVALLGTAMALQRLERHIEAEDVYKRVLELSPRSDLAWLELGDLYRDTERLDDAIAAYEEAGRLAVSAPQAEEVALRLNPLYAQKLASMIGAQERGEADREDVIALGAALVRRGFNEDALRLLRMSLDDAVEDARIYAWIGRAELARGETDRGLAMLERAIRLTPGDLDLWAELADLYGRTDRLDDAERALAEIGRRTTDDTVRDNAERSLALMQAQRLHAEGDVAGALAGFERLVDRYPEDVGLAIGRARLLLSTGRDAEAEQVFAGLLAADPGNIGLYLNVAQAYREEDRPQQAERIYREALAVDPGNVTTRLALGGFYQVNERYEDAFAEFEQAIELAEGTPQEAQARQFMGGLARAVIERGRERVASGDHERAEALFLLAVDRWPDTQQGRFWLSELYRMQGDYARQAEYLAAIVETSDANILTKRRLAIAWDNAGRPDEAEPVLREVIAAFPFDSDIQARLAELHDRQGRDELARSGYIQLLSINPSTEWRIKALDRLGLATARAHRERGEPEQALVAARQVLEEVPDEALVHMEIARIHEQAGRVEEAEAAWREAQRLAPGEAEARLGLARLFARTSRTQDAIVTYHQVATERPPSARAEEARGELDELLTQRSREQVARAIEQNTPEARAALIPMGAELIRLGSLDAAREVLEHVIRVDPGNAAAHYWLGRVFAERREFADASVVLKRSVDLEPGNAQYQLGLGHVYRELQLDRPAEEALEQSIRIDPSNPAARFELAAVYHARGDEARAREQYVRVLEQATDRGSVARALEALGLEEDPDRLERERLETALRVFEQSMQVVPQAPQVRLYVAIILHRMQRFEEAEAMYRDIMASDAGQAQAALRLAQLFGETGRLDEGIELYDRVIERVREPRINALAAQQQTGLHVRKAAQLAEALERGEGDAEEARRLGRILVERNAHDQALPMLEAAVRRAPNDPQLWYYLGRAHADRGRFEPGIDALERAVRIVPDNHLLRSHLAIAYARSGDVDKAVPIYESLSRQTDDPQLQRQARMSLGLLRGERFAIAGDFELALREYDALLELEPDDVSLLGQRGLMLVQLGREDEADAVFERVLELAPDNLAVRLRLAGIYRGREETARYVEQLAAIIAIDPRSAESRQARTQLGFDTATELLAGGEPEEAEAVLERILSTVPHDPLTRFQLGQAYLEQGRFAEAEAEWVEVARLVPDYPNVYLALGRLYERLERQDGAMRAYERVLDIDRTSPVAREAQPLLAGLYGSRAQALLAEGREEEARQELLKLIASDPSNVPARTALASLHGQARRYEEAQRELEAAARIQPDNPRVQVQLAGVYALTEQDMRAAEAFGNAVALTTDERQAEPLVRELIMSLARHMVSQDRPYSAIRHLRGLNDQGLGNDRTYQLLAAIYRQQGRFDEATRAFRDAVRFAPDNVLMRYNLAELYERSNDLDLALIQYRHIVRVGTPGELIVEEARRRASMLRGRLARFSSQLSYSLTMGESNIEEQDLGGTGALNTSFSSQLFYNLGTNFRLTPSLDLRLDTGLIYVSNHSTERDTLVPRLGLSSTLNYPRHFYSITGHASDIHELISDNFQGRTYNASATAGIRFTDAQDLLQGLGWRRTRFDSQGEDRIERAAETRVTVEPEADANPRLRRALEAAHRRDLLGRDTAISGEGVRRYQVREGDGLRDIAAALSFDALRWTEESRDDPRIVDPAVIVPGDTVVLIDRGNGPTILIETPGRAITQFDLLAPEERLEREAAVRSAVEEGMEHYRAGLSLQRRGRFDAAQGRFEQVLAVVPGDPLTLLNLGIARERQGDLRGAEHALVAAMEADPSLQQARVHLARLYAQHGVFARAVAMLEDIVARQGRDGGPEGAPEGAVEVAQRMAEPMRDVSPLGQAAIGGLLRVADVLVGLGEPAAARQVLEAMLDEPAAEAEASHRLAVILLEEGQAAEAAAHATRAVELAPEPRFQLARARALRGAGEHEPAIEAYERVLEGTEEAAVIEAARRESGLARAAAREAGGDAAGALEIYEALLEAHPEDAEILVGAAGAAQRSGRNGEAIGLIERAIAVEPQRFDLHLRLADLRSRAGDREAANEALAAAMGVGDEAQRREVLDRLGFEQGLDLIHQGRSGRALAIMERAQAVAPDEPLVLLNIGAIRQQQRRIPEAEAAFLQVLDDDPLNLTARLRLGLLYGETERIDRAITMLERVASEGIGRDAGRRAAEALERLEQRRLRRLVGEDVERSAPTMKTLQARFFYSDTDLPVRSLTESLSYGTTLSFFYRSLNRGDWILNYTFATRENKDPLGTDYAYVWNDLGITWRKSVPNPWGLFGASATIPGLTGTISYNREARTYTFADTNALNTLGIQARRNHTTDTLSLGLNFQPPNQDKLNVFLNYTWGRSRADLPVGILFSPDGIPVAFQSRGLGDFDPSYLSLGLGFQF